jgi:hypothetical protein
MTKIDETAMIEAGARAICRDIAGMRWEEAGAPVRGYLIRLAGQAIAAAYPWRPLAQAPRDGRTVELRVPGQAGRQFARVYETDGVVHVSRMLECHFGFGKVSSGPTFAQLCADGAEVRELLL